MAFVLKLCGYTNTNGNQLAKKQKKNMVSPLHFYHNKTMVNFHKGGLGFALFIICDPYLWG